MSVLPSPPPTHLHLSLGNFTVGVTPVDNPEQAIRDLWEGPLWLCAHPLYHWFSRHILASFPFEMCFGLLLWSWGSLYGKTAILWKDSFGTFPFLEPLCEVFFRFGSIAAAQNVPCSSLLGVSVCQPLSVCYPFTSLLEASGHSDRDMPPC